MKVNVNKTEQGFTLIETSIAMVVMMVAALSVVSLFVYSMQNNVGGSDRTLAMAVAQQQLEELRSVRFDHLSLTAGQTTRTLRNGDRNYSVVTNIVDETNANGTARRLKRLTISVTPQYGQHAWQRTAVVLTSYRSTLAQGNFAAQ